MAKKDTQLKLVDAPVFHYWDAFYKSFYSKRLYVDVGKRWRGLGLIYLLLAIALLSIPFAIKMSITFGEAYNEQIIQPLIKVPTVYVQNGKVVFDKPMPYLIKNNKDQVVLAIDTTGKINGYTPEYPWLSILINKDSMSFKIPTPQLFKSSPAQTNNSPPMSQIFSKNDNFVFNGTSIIKDNSIYNFKYAAQIFIYPVIVGLLYSLLVVIFLILAFLGQVFASIFFSYKMPFVQSSRIFMVASTPMLLGLTAALTMDAIFPGFGFILMALIAIYFGFAIYALKAESRSLVHR